MLRPDHRQLYNSEFYRLIDIINKNLKRRSNVVVFRSRNRHDNILNLLQEYGIIASYQNYKGFILVRTRGANNPINAPNRCITDVRMRVRLGRRNGSATLSEMRSNNLRNGHNVLYILVTDKGLVTSTEAISHNVGGKLLFELA